MKRKLKRIAGWFILTQLLTIGLFLVTLCFVEGSFWAKLAVSEACVLGMLAFIFLMTIALKWID